MIAGLGFALGLRHAADSDHVVAVTAIAARYKRVGPLPPWASSGASATP